MAVDVGKATGKLTLDGSSFISTLKEINEYMTTFKDLTADVQKAFSDLSTASSNFSISGFDSSTLTPIQQALQQTGEQIQNNINPNPVEETNSAFITLQDTLKGGFSLAVNGAVDLVKGTFSVFEKFSEKVVGLTQEAVQVGMSFDAEMSKVMSIVGDVSDEALDEMIDKANEMGLSFETDGDNAAVAMDILREKAKEMGAQTRFTASQAADALSYMAMAGWKGTQMLDGLSGIMSLAAASGEDLATTSDIVTDALTAFKLSAEDATHFADVLAAASSNSNTNVGLMGETFKYVASMAGTMGYNIEDTAVAIGLMANTGIKGSQAGTALRNIITNLAKPSDTVAAAMTELGLSLADEEGNTKSLMEVMKDLRNAFSELSNDSSMEEYLDWIELYNKSLEEGELTEEEYEQAIKSVTANFLKSTDSIKAQNAAAIAGKYGLSGLLAIVNASDEDFDKLTEAIYNAQGAAGSMEDIQMSNLQGATDVLKSTYESLQLTISDMLKDTATENVNFFQSIISDITKITKEEGFGGLVKGVTQIIPKIVEHLAPLLPDILKILLDSFWGLINGLLNAIPKALPSIIEAGLGLFMGLITGLTSVSQKLIKMLPSIIALLCNTLDANIDTLITAALDFFLGMLVGIAEATPKIVDSIIKLIPKIVDTLLDHLVDIVEAGVKIIVALIQGLLDPKVLTDLGLAIAKIIVDIQTFFHSVDWYKTMVIIFAGIGDALAAVFKIAFSAIDSLFGTNLVAWQESFGSFISTLQNQSFELGKSIADSMNKTENELNTLASKYEGNYQDMLEAYKKLVAEGVNAQEAMAAAYQHYFTSSEAQYVFRERYASSLGGANMIADTIGTSGMSNREVVDVLSKTTGNTYNFYTTEPIDEKKAADEVEQVQKDLLRGYRGGFKEIMYG